MKFDDNFIDSHYATVRRLLTQSSRKIPSWGICIKSITNVESMINI